MSTSEPPQPLVESTAVMTLNREDPLANESDSSGSSEIQSSTPASPRIPLPDVQDAHLTSSPAPELDTGPSMPSQASLSPEDASEGPLETEPSESAPNDGDSLRPFTEGAVFRQSDTAHSRRRRASEIKKLERLENDLARKYKMTGAIDSVDVFNRTKAIARSTMDPNTIKSLRQLHTLYKLRSEVEIDNSARGVFSVDASRFWAVVIGIDAYLQYPLRGCVTDALAMHKYLRDTLCVPVGQIQLLLGQRDRFDSSSQRHARPPTTDDTAPTHANILKALYGLIDHPGIKNGDNIIIYFAGHGSTYDLSQLYRSGAESDYDAIESIGSIDALCPMDRLSQGISDISDREVNSILAQIARTKGNRITFILDCCHSASVNRRLPDEGARTVPPLSGNHIHTMLSNADERLKNFPGYRTVSESGWSPDMTSHVVLAACKEFQFAKEVEGAGGGGLGFHGLFTTSLIRALQSRQLKEGATYVDLVHALPRWPRQTPVVAGECKDAPLWYQGRPRL